MTAPKPVRLSVPEYRRRLNESPLESTDVWFAVKSVADALQQNTGLIAFHVIEVGTHDVEVSVPYDAFDAWVTALGGAVKNSAEHTTRGDYRRAELDEPNERVVLRAYRPRLGQVS